MNRHKPEDFVFDHNLENAQTDTEVNAMLDNPTWNPRHVPEALSWLHGESVTLLGDFVVAIIMDLIGVTPQDILAHIRMISEQSWRIFRFLIELPICRFMGMLSGMSHPRHRERKWNTISN